MASLLKIDKLFSTRSTFDSSKREEIEKQLMKDAMSRARKKATIMAEIAGAKIKGVYTISDTGLNDLGSRFILSNYPYERIFNDEGFGDPRAVRSMSLSKRITNSIEIPKSLTISAKITAIFSLQN